MKGNILLIFFLVIVFFSPIQAKTMTVEKKRLSEYVDPNIGSVHCRWFFYTPAAVPFGMAKLAPSTNAHYGNPGGWEAVGYDNRHSSIEGFACFHEFQIGGIVLAPSVGVLQTTPGELDKPDEGYRSHFDKKEEYATPGYYSVLLKDYNIKVELTATKRVGYQRYTFPKSSASHIIFDIGNKQGESGAVKDARVELTKDGRVEGYVITSPQYVKKYQPGAEIKMYFSAILNKKPKSYGVFRHNDIQKDKKEISGEGAGLYLTFETKANESVTVKIGLSYTSIENARLNMKKEANNMTFDQAKRNSFKTWDDYLGRIVVEGKNETDKIKFYTGLYHSLLGRGLANDVNGAYPMNNGQVGHIELDENKRPLHNHYNTDAIWGAFWNLTQLWTIAYPEYFTDWIQSQLLVYKDAGWLGDGIACSKYVSGVGTNFIGLTIASAYNCGLLNSNIDLAYEAAIKNELCWENRIEGAGKMDTKQFVEKGYSPYIEKLVGTTTPEGSRFAASHTLEYSFSAYAVGQFAKKMGKNSDYARLNGLSKGWKLLYDNQTNFIRPRDVTGQFTESFNPLEAWKGFQEGNAWQYTFYVPHDIEELITIIGKDTFNNRLDSIFTNSQKSVFGGGTTIDAFAGVKGLYNHGNQPNLHASWLFNFSGKPSLTQKWVRTICNEFYGTESIHGYGYGQDEDQGQLGAWYVISSIGLFDVKGLTDVNPQFQIGSPLFDRITITTPGKKPFIIEAVNNSDKNIYVKEIFFNGKKLSEPRLLFQTIKGGGNLKLMMDSTPTNTY
ncbi:MAG: GH92 family glycosyl hydrolase [Proteiniphilum sp.]